MFELYDIFDNNEINVILLIVLVLFLALIIFGLGYYDYKMRQRLEKIQGDVNSMSILFNSNNNKQNNDNKDNKDNKDKNNDVDYKKKYEDLVKSKDVDEPVSVQYSPSEYATLLKYNPILPYSAFTMDIINNSYMDYHEREALASDERYFNLSNFDNIYDQ